MSVLERDVIALCEASIFLLRLKNTFYYHRSIVSFGKKQKIIFTAKNNFQEFCFASLVLFFSK